MVKQRTKLIVYTILITAIIVLLSRGVLADDYQFKYGMGLNEQKPTGSIKLLSIRQESTFMGPIYDAIEGGLWIDNLGVDRRSAGFCKYQYGVKTGPRVGVYAKGFWGVSLQTGTDSQLGSMVEFSQDAGIGIRDEESFLETGYTHFSNAGLSTRNKGRDFVTLSIGLRF